MEIDSMLEGILFASGDPMPVSRICALLGATQEEVLTAAGRLADMYSFEVRGIRLIKLEDSLQLVSAPELSDIIRRALETRKAPKLSQAALEVLAITAYYQPVTRVYIEKVRGVDSSYTVGMLTERGLIEECGRLVDIDETLNVVPELSTDWEISIAPRVAVPLNKRCSRKWLTPATASVSSREPVLTKKPTAATPSR